MSRINYAVGNTKDRDVQYWPTILRAQIPDLTFAPDPSLYDEIWPVDVTEAQVMALSWRVKKWLLTGGITIGLTSVRTGLDTTVYSGTATLEGYLYPIREGGPCATEADLLYRVFTWPFSTGVNAGKQFTTLGNDGIAAQDGALIQDTWEVTGARTPDGGGSIPISLSGTKELNMTIGAGFPYLFNAGLFSPRFDSLDGPNSIGYIGAVIPGGAGFEIAASANFNRNPRTIASAVFPSGEIVTPGTFTIRSHIAPDFVVPIEVGSSQSGGAGSTTAGSNSGAFILEAVEFWSYGGTWDTSSGVQLLEPFRA